MTDTLLMLHVKRFGFRYVTYLETYTLFVACTVNVLDFTENEVSSGDKELAREANARLHFGLEILRQANSTPAAARCASTICQLFNKQKASVRDDTTERGPEREASQTVSSSSTSGLEISSNIQTFMPTPASSATTLSFPATSQPSSLPVVQGHYIDPIISAGIPYIQDADADGDAEHTLQSPVPVETPLRWLPENVQDDVSWMLMADANFNGDFNFSPIADLS
ncbi:hypothetical protein PC116_g30316 [Phytophthora cactorum]|nr:hypothetical protein PC116_g30316 [Phytophthora cactorum]